MSSQKPLSPMTEVKDMAEAIGSFLPVEDLARLSVTSKATQMMFSKPSIQMKLLKAVFDADPKRVRELLEKSETKESSCFVLEKTHGKETYYSKKERKIVTRREWKSISPLEAAAWSGDIFLVKELLTHVPKNDYLEALNQLKGILERKESEENGEFLAPFKNVLKAYQEYYTQMAAGISNAEADAVWDQIWKQGQRLLSMYGLQEYCDPKPFFPLPSFKEEPRRSLILDYLASRPDYIQESYGITLNLDEDSVGIEAALYKGRHKEVSFENGWQAYIGGHNGSREKPPHDRDAIAHLCDVRTKELNELIKDLEQQLLCEKSEKSDIKKTIG